MPKRVYRKRPTTDIVLSQEQNRAVEHLLSFSKPIQTLGGYAGTGKTTVIKTLRAQLPDYAVVAYTGKAAHVLRRKGITGAGTIHSCIYTPDGEQTIVDAKGRRIKRPVFKLKPACELAVDGFIVDEASMVSKQIYKDLRSYNVPLIFVGDHGQLEPVGDKFSLMTNPDITLETIHRNAGEIARFAQFIREGNAPFEWQYHQQRTGKQVRFITFEQIEGLDFLAYDQIICGTNKTRVILNRGFRDAWDFPAKRPVKGDRVMCLQNDRQIGVFNGQQGTVAGVFGTTMKFEVEGEVYKVEFRPEQFNKVKPPKYRGHDAPLPFDYAYVITCHKAQGDEFDSVCVYEQILNPESHHRWAYTAASRARKKLTWICH